MQPSASLPLGLCRRLPGRLLAAALLLPSLFAARANPFQHDVSVATVTDFTPEGKALRVPTPGTPVYFVAHKIGFQNLSTAVRGDKPPSDSVMEGVILKVLAKQGYLQADDQHPPTQLLVLMWGTLNANYLDDIPDSNQDDADAANSQVQLNRKQLLKFLGGDKLGLITKDGKLETEEKFGPNIHSRAAMKVADVAENDLMVASIGSYDYQSCIPDPNTGVAAKPRLLWKTKIGCPSLGLSLADALPVAMTIAAPNIGRETGQPVWVNATDKFKTHVDVGEATVKEYLDPKTGKPIGTSEAPPAKTDKKP